MIEGPSIDEWRIKFVLYEWCPRDPDGESCPKQHERQFLVHHWFEGRACCTAAEALPAEMLPRVKFEKL